MSRIILSDAAINGIKNVTVRTPSHDEKYLQLQKEADERIKQDRRYYANAAMKAKNYIARTKEQGMKEEIWG